MHFAWFIWHFWHVGLAQIGLKCQIIGCKTFFDFLELPLYISRWDAQRVGALEIFQKNAFCHPPRPTTND